MRRIRKKTDIPDRIKTNPHAFRKGRATYLAAQGMNQAQLCEFGGWVQGSGEVAVYIRMAESDVEQGIREISGIQKREDDTEEDLDPVKCQECKKLNKFEAENCRDCGATLKTSDLFTEVQIEEMKDELKTKMIEEDIGKSEEEIIEGLEKFPMTTHGVSRYVNCHYDTAKKRLEELERDGVLTKEGDKWSKRAIQ